MRKTILLLINGFGIEKKDSYEVYSKELMPNFDYMTKNYIFSSLNTTAGDFINAYKDFSVEEVSKHKEDEIDKLIFDKALNKNVVLQDLSSKLTKENKLHIFYSLKDGSKLHQLKEFIKIINSNKEKNVFVHIVLTGTSVNDYANITKAITKLSFEIGGLAKVGFVVGSEKINTDDVLRTFYKEFGEHWNESTKKFDILKKDMINPKDAGVFYINGGFSLSENDVLFFANFTNIECEKFYLEISKVSLIKFSLYPFKDEMPYAFTREISEYKAVGDIIVKHNIKLLVITNETRINQINYYLNGMKKIINPNITYAKYDSSLFSTKNNIINLVEQGFDGIILDFDIGSYINLDQIKQTLKSIDPIIKPISEASSEKNYTFIISSNYGMHTQVNDGVVTRIINFAGRVPCVYQNNEFTKDKYLLVNGNSHDLALTFLTNICDEVKSNRLVKKQTGLDKVLNKAR